MVTVSLRLLLSLLILKLSPSSMLLPGILLRGVLLLLLGFTLLGLLLGCTSTDLMILLHRLGPLWNNVKVYFCVRCLLGNCVNMTPVKDLFKRVPVPTLLLSSPLRCPRTWCARCRTLVLDASQSALLAVQLLLSFCENLLNLPTNVTTGNDSRLNWMSALASSLSRLMFWLNCPWLCCLNLRTRLRVTMLFTSEHVRLPRNVILRYSGLFGIL